MTKQKTMPNNQRGVAALAAVTNGLFQRPAKCELVVVALSHWDDMVKAA